MSEYIESDKIKSKISEIADNVNESQTWKELNSFANDLYKELKGLEVFNKLELDPVSMSTGSLSIYLDTFPKNIYLKIWCVESNLDSTYYLSFFSKRNDFFEVQLDQTFNEKGVMPISNLEDAMDIILNFVANEIYSNRHTLLLD
jgi:hypothetical protein